MRSICLLEEHGDGTNMYFLNIDNDIEEVALTAYITTNESSVIELGRLSKHEWNRQSYRVLTHYCENEKNRSGEFWPQDIGEYPC